MIIIKSVNVQLSQRIVILFRLDDVLKIATAVFEECREDRLQRACDHVDKVVQQHRTSDHFIDEQMDSLIINLADDSSSDSSDDSSTDTASETERRNANFVCIDCKLYVNVYNKRL